MGAWYLGNVIAGMAGGLIAYGIGRIESIAPWKVVEDIHRSCSLSLLTDHSGSVPYLRGTYLIVVGRHILLSPRYSDECKISQRAGSHQGCQASGAEQDWHQRQHLEILPGHRSHPGHQDMAVGHYPNGHECCQWRRTEREYYRTRITPINERS